MQAPASQIQIQQSKIDSQQKTAKQKSKCTSGTSKSEQST